MQAIYVSIKVAHITNTIDIEISGFTEDADLNSAVEDEVQGYLDDWDQQAIDECEANGTLPSTEEWEVFTTDDNFVFQSSLDPESWLWEWIEYFTGSCCLEEGVCRAASYLGVTPENVEEAYAGQHRSHADFAEETADSMGAVSDNNAWPNNCIDWEQASTDLMMDYSEEDGYYFRQM